jgi:hypothetical protein
VCSIEDAEMIIEAAAELTSVTALHNCHLETTWEDEHGPEEEDNNHDSVQQLNDRNLVQHHNNRTQNKHEPSGKSKSNFR